LHRNQPVQAAACRTYMSHQCFSVASWCLFAACRGSRRRCPADVARQEVGKACRALWLQDNARVDWHTVLWVSSIATYSVDLWHSLALQTGPRWWAATCCQPLSAAHGGSDQCSHGLCFATFRQSVAAYLPIRPPLHCIHSGTATGSACGLRPALCGRPGWSSQSTPPPPTCWASL
jgi:hypothetical protein